MKKLNNFHIQRASLQYELHNVLSSWNQLTRVVLWLSGTGKLT